MYTLSEVSKLMQVNDFTDKKSEVLRWINEGKVQYQLADDGTFKIPQSEVQRLLESKWKEIVFQSVKQYETALQAMIARLYDQHSGALGKLESLFGLVKFGFVKLASSRFRMDHDLRTAKQFYYMNLQVSEVYRKFARQVEEQLSYSAYQLVPLKDRVLWGLFSQRHDLVMNIAEQYGSSSKEVNQEDLFIKYLLLKKDREAENYLSQLDRNSAPVPVYQALLYQDVRQLNSILHRLAEEKYNYYTQGMIRLPYFILCDDLLLYGWLAQTRGIPVSFRHRIMPEICFRPQRINYPNLSFLPEEFRYLLS
jgi:hypothetical protein